MRLQLFAVVHSQHNNVMHAKPDLLVVFKLMIMHSGSAIAAVITLGPRILKTRKT